MLRNDDGCFRLELSIATEMNLKIYEIGGTGAHLQVQGFDREGYVKPPSKYSKPNILSKLTAAPYGLVDSGRLRYLNSYNSMTENANPNTNVPYTANAINLDFFW